MTTKRCLTLYAPVVRAGPTQIEWLFRPRNDAFGLSLWLWLEVCLTAGGEIFASLHEYARRTRRGVALPDNLGFIVDLPNRRSFSPDVAFWTGGPLTAKFLEGAPIFAVEVRSEEDYGPAAERAMAAKRADYFAAGTLVVWDVDTLRAEVVRVYRSDHPTVATTYSRAQRAEAEPALPGWSMPVADLFPPFLP